MLEALQRGGPPLRVELQHGRQEGGERLGLLHTPVVLVHLETRVRVRGTPVQSLLTSTRTRLQGFSLVMCFSLPALVNHCLLCLPRVITLNMPTCTLAYDPWTLIVMNPAGSSKIL